jgi:tetratricopeptide (TPR) repeat protein
VGVVALSLGLVGGGLYWFRLAGRPLSVPSGKAVADSRARVQELFDGALNAVERGDRDVFRQSVEELRALPGTAGHLELLHGVSLTFSGETEAALAQISRVPPRGTLRRPMLLWSAECFRRLGRLGDAEQLLKQLVSDLPDDAEAHRRLGAVYHSLGAMDFALAAWRNTARLDPDDYRAYRMLGLVLSADYANYTAAIEQYRLALSKKVPESEDGPLRIELAQCLIEQRDYAAALEVLESVPEASRILVMRAECHWSTGELDQARLLLARAEELQPGNSAGRILKARMLLDDGQREEAIALYRDILEREPHDFQTRYQLALAYQAHGDSEAYERELRHYQESEKKRAELFDMYRVAMKNPADAQIREQISALCEELGLESLAETWRTAAKNARALLGEFPADTVSPNSSETP